jgi:hypothetical protein
MDAEENQRQVFLPRPQPLEIAKGAIPTFPPPRRQSRMEKWKSKSRIPTFAPARFPYFQNQKKGDPAAGRFAPASRLI